MKNIINNKKIVKVTGGTGGHIFPAISLAEYFSNKLLDVNFITDKRGKNNPNLAALNPITINVKGFVGKSIFQKIISIFLIIIYLCKSLLFLKRNKTDMVIGFGSYVQVPVIIAAKILNIKVLLHESNIILGNANKYFWHYARVRATAYNIINSSKNYEIVGMPVRKEILNLYKENYKFPKKNNKINILILGGSLGSLILSKKLSKQICKLPIKIKKRLNVAHQSKVEDIKDIKSNYKLENIKFEVRAYFYNIHKKLKQSTLVICRAGASTISENLIAGIPAIYIPLHNSVGAHQFFNAQMIKNNKAGWLIKENEIIKPKFISLLSSLLSSNEPLEEASKNCKKIAKPQAQENLYRLVTGELYEKL